MYHPGYLILVGGIETNRSLRQQSLLTGADKEEVFSYLAHSCGDFQSHLQGSSPAKDKNVHKRHIVQAM